MNFVKSVFSSKSKKKQRTGDMGLCASSNAALPGESGEAQDEFKSWPSQDAVNRKREESAQEKGLRARKDLVTDKAKDRLKRSSSTVNEAMVHLRVGQDVRDFYDGADDGPLLEKVTGGTVRIVTRKEGQRALRLQAFAY